MKKTTFLNNYKSYAYTKDYTILNKLAFDTIDYIKNNNYKNLDLDFTNVAINKDFLLNFNIAIEIVFKNSKFIEDWQKLSNSKQKKILLFNMIAFSMKNDLFFDRSMSVYNKVSQNYSQKAYTKNIKLKLNELFYQVALNLSEDIVYIEQ